MNPKEIRKRRARKLEGKRTGIARTLATLIDIYVEKGHVSVQGVEALQDRAREYERLDKLTEEAKEHARRVPSAPNLVKAS